MDLKQQIEVLSERLVALCSRELKKSAESTVAFALDSVSDNFRFGSHNHLATGADMDLNVCPLCRAPDANGFCGCLSVMAKSEDYIDLKNQADPKKRIKEAPGEHEGLVPSDRPIKEVDTGDGTGGDIKKGKKVGGKMEKAEMTPAAPGMAPKPPMAPAAVKLPGTGSAPTIAKPTLPSAGNTPRTAAGPAQIKLPGAGMGHAPKIKQQAGGNVISANPPPAAPGLGSMKGPMMKTEFKELSKSEDFGKCVLCGNNEHIGVCK